MSSLFELFFYWPKINPAGNYYSKTTCKTLEKCDTLFEYGYEQVLDIDALEIFDRYKLYKSEKRKFMLENAWHNLWMC